MGIKIIVGIILLLIVFFAGFSLGRVSNSSANSDPQQIAAPKITSQQTLNKSFTFPVKDTTGTVVTSFTYTITSAQTQDEIILKGQPATAIKGHTFLVLNIKLINSSNQSLTVNTRDYVRLSVNNSSETIAPDIHNDPVQLQAIATTPTRVGFTINNTYNHLILKVGEINGEKTDIPLTITTK